MKNASVNEKLSSNSDLPLRKWSGIAFACARNDDGKYRLKLHS